MPDNDRSPFLPDYTDEDNSPELPSNSRTDSADIADNVNFGYNILSAGLYAGLAGEGVRYEEKDRNKHTEWSKKMDKANRYGTAADSALAAGFGGAANIARLVSDSRSRNAAKHNIRKKKELGWSSWAAGIGLVGNTATAGRSITNFGWDTQEENSKSAKADSWLGTISYASGFFSSMFNMIGSARGNSLRKDTSQQLETKIRNIRDSADDSADAATKKNAQEKVAALQQAKQFNDIKKGRYNKGAFSFVGSALSNTALTLDAFKIFGKGKAATLAGGLAPALGVLFDVGEKIASARSDKKIKRDEDKLKCKVVDEYLKSQRGEVGEDKYAAKDQETLQALDGSIRLDDGRLTPEQINTAYEAITRQRAQSILSLSDDAEKSEILGALGLDDSEGGITEEEVMAALSGE